MDMRIDANAGLAKRLRHNEVRGLAPDAIECQQVIDIVRHFAAELVDEVAADSANHARLGVIEPDRIDELL
jgi:hypothetical protein